MNWNAIFNYRTMSITLLVVFLVLVWAFGPTLGLPTLGSQLLVSVLLLFLWSIVWMVGKVIEDRSSQKMENLIRKDADESVIKASAESRSEVNKIRKQLLDAIDTLKTSNLGRTRGRAALYELPWYMILGHPAAGKSCAINHAGLNFPITGKGGNSVQGIGGTRTCDWFFSSEGILLDTAGRYAANKEDRGEWLGFLKLLRKHRSRAPLNGVLVGISLLELQKAHAETFAPFVRQLRHRINEVEDIFGMKVPVYLVFTMMDLLPGFAPFFEDLSEEERRQAWGASLTHDQGPAFNVLDAVTTQFELLNRGLVQAGMDRLATSRSNLARPALFSFPLEFNGIKPSVLKLVELLTEANPYHSRPLIRGFYFTSALQSGTPELMMAKRISEHFSLAPSTDAKTTDLPSRAYFLESLFRKVIFPDRFLVGRGANPRRNRVRLMGLAGGLSALALVVGIWSYAFVLNQKLVSETTQELALASRILQGPQPAGMRLRALQLLQARIELLRRYRREGAPWSLRWGLYRGNDVEKVLREEYNQGLRALMLMPVQLELERNLDVFLKEPASQVTADASGALPKGTAQETSYNTLKTYLMLHQQEHMDASHLADQLPRFWMPWLESQAGETSPPELKRMAERTVAFYVSQIKEPDMPLIDNRATLVTQVRTRLAGDIQFLSPFERIYAEIKARANTQFPAISVGSILENRDQDLIAGSSTVQGSFTVAAWNGFIQKSIHEASRGAFEGTDWVLASSLDNDLSRLGKAEENAAKLLALYKADYIKEWDRFLTGIAIQGFDGPDTSAEGLGRLADLQHSPIRMIFTRAAAETAWDNASPTAKAADSTKNQLLERTSRIIGPGAPGPQDTSATLGEVGGHFSILGQLVHAGSGKAPIEAYLELLQKLKSRMSSLSGTGDPGNAARQFFQATLSGGSELAETQNFVDSNLLASASESARAIVRPLLIRPLTQSCQSLVPLVEQDINRAWNQQVLSQWGNLAGKYPFSDSSNDAALSDIVRFLKPGEGALPRFVANTLGPIVTRRGDGIAARNSGWPEVRLNPSVIGSISRLLHAAEAILQEGETCRFELQATTTPRIRETILELDGQRLQYRNGVESWTAFTWPAPNGSQGARIQVVSNEGASAQVASFSGRLSFMRLLDMARIDASRGTPQLEWRFRVPQTFTTRNAREPHREEAFPNPVRFNFRMVSGTNPLNLTALRHHSLPSRITP